MSFRFGTECRCGNTLRYNVQQGAVCDKPCPGNSTQVCGGKGVAAPDQRR